MNKEETLHRIKAVEEQVRKGKEAAHAEREKILRTARREALELRDSLRSEADRRAGAIISEAEAAIAREKELVLAEGRKAARAMRDLADLNLERAVDRLLERFKGAVHA